MKVKKEHYEAMECTLKALPLYYIGIEEAELKLKDLQEEYNDGISGIDYTPELKSITNNISRLTEETALQNIERQKRIEIQIKFMKKKVEEIERQINKLDSKESELLFLVFKEGLRWDEVAEKMNYSRMQCFRIKKSGIEKLTFINYNEKCII